MLDIRLIREQPDMVKEGLRLVGADPRWLTPSLGSTRSDGASRAR